MLDEPELDQLQAGIVLQAYLPDSHGALDARSPRGPSSATRAGGADVKVRLVKGANLAMERVDAELHGWVQAPYATKAEVDASYKRLRRAAAATAATPAALRVGVASHNLFDVAWALLVARDRGVADRIEIEMLEGMAPPQARAVARRRRRLLLYTPVVTAEDFDVGIAYLFRRLDENTAPENFLRHAVHAARRLARVRRARRRASAGAVAERHARVTPAPRGQGRRPSRRSTPSRSPTSPTPTPPLADDRAWIAGVRDLAVTAGRAPRSPPIPPTSTTSSPGRARRQPGWWATSAPSAAGRRSTGSPSELAARRAGRSSP